MGDPFVEIHKDEITREAFRIYQYRERLKQPDDPAGNFTAAIAVIKNRYKGGPQYLGFKVVGYTPDLQ